MSDQEVRRRTLGLTAAMYSYLVERGSPASIREIAAGVSSQFPNPPSSSVRGCLQNERYFQRVERGVFMARNNASEG